MATVDLIALQSGILPWLCFALTCRGLSPMLNLALAGVDPTFFFRGKLRYWAEQAMKKNGEDWQVSTVEDFESWVSDIRHHILPAINLLFTWTPLLDYNDNYIAKCPDHDYSLHIQATIERHSWIDQEKGALHRWEVSRPRD